MACAGTQREGITFSEALAETAGQRRSEAGPQVSEAWTEGAEAGVHLAGWKRRQEGRGTGRHSSRSAHLNAELGA